MEIFSGGESEPTPDRQGVERVLSSPKFQSALLHPRLSSLALVGLDGKEVISMRRMNVVALVRITTLKMVWEIRCW